MPDSNRHGYITFGWIATIVGAVLFFAILNSQYSSAQKSAEYAYKCAEQYKRLTSAPADVAASTGHQEGDNRTDKDQPDTDWCDLAAQQSMAESTYSMNIAAWATVIFTGVGAFLIWRTLIATQDTVAETRRIGEAQVRAYLGVERIELSRLRPKRGHPANFKVEFHIKNFGQSMAKAVSVKTWASARGAPVQCKASEGVGDRVDHNFGIVNPDHAPMGFVQILDNVPVSDIRMKFEILYEDIFGDRWEQGAEFYPLQKGNGPHVMYVMPDTSYEKKRE